jgi:hypothetical protein
MSNEKWKMVFQNPAQLIKKQLFQRLSYRLD